jgi:type II secretory pathway pseudopilin PulG
VNDPYAGERRAHPAVPAEAGFTLIEMGLVILIITVMLGLTLPRLRDPQHAQLVSQTRKLAVLFRYLREEAILRGRIYRLTFDLDQQGYMVSSSPIGIDGGGGFSSETGMLARPVLLQPPLGIADVVLPFTAGKVFEGAVPVHFYPDGTVDAAIVHLHNEKEAYTLHAEPLTGRVYVLADYVKFDYSG